MPIIGRQSQQADRAADAQLRSDAELSHVSILRAARVRHKAIGRGLQQYFDSVVAEKIPTEFMEILNRDDRQSV